MSERLTDDAIARIEHEFNYAWAHGWIGDLTLKDSRLLLAEIANLRAQLASATATIAEQTQRADAAEGREAGLRLAMEQIQQESGRKTCGEDACDRALCRVHFKGWELATAALATPANGASEVT